MTNKEALTVLGALGVILPEPPLEIMEALAMGMIALERAEEITDLDVAMEESLERALKEYLESEEAENTPTSVWDNEDTDEFGGF